MATQESEAAQEIVSNGEVKKRMTHLVPLLSILRPGERAVFYVFESGVGGPLTFKRLADRYTSDVVSAGWF